MRPALLCLFLLIPSAGIAAEGIPLYESLRDSIVTVTGRSAVRSPEKKVGIYTTTGAGVILDAAGTIATNTHVIYGSQAIMVTLSRGKTFDAEVLFVSPQDDLSLIRIPAPEGLKPVSWAETGLIQLDDEVITIGHSDILRSTISGGRITAIGVRKDDADRAPAFFEVNINHYQGDSGGPVFDRRGNFLGLMNARRVTRNRSSLVIPSDKVHSAYLNVATQVEKR